MTDNPIFRSADRADTYIEREQARPADQLTPPEVADEPPSRRRRRTGQESVETSKPKLEAVPQPPPPAVAAVDLDTMSRDLSGSWFTAEDDGDSEGERSTRARQGWRGGLARLGLPLKPGAAELAALEEERELAQAEAIVRQSTWTRSVTILVANRKGGVAKTPTAILLGGMLAHVRGGGVVIPEVSDDPGMIALRAEGSPRRGLGELIEEVASISSAGQLAGYTAPQTSHAAVIGSPNPRRVLTGEDVEKMHRLLSEYYAIQVLDSGNVYGSDAFQASVSLADALVIPVNDGADSVQDALALVHNLSQTERGRQLVASATVLRARNVTASDRMRGRVDAVLGGLGVLRIIDVPADAHIASRGELSLASLQPQTRHAFLHAAATVVQSLHTLESR